MGQMEFACFALTACVFQQAVLLDSYAASAVSKEREGMQGVFSTWYKCCYGDLYSSSLHHFTLPRLSTAEYERSELR